MTDIKKPQLVNQSVLSFDEIHNAKAPTILRRYFLFLVLLSGFISELGGLGSNLAIMLMEMSFVVLCVSLYGKRAFPLPDFKSQPFFLSLILLWAIWGLLSFSRASFTYNNDQITLSLIRQLEYFSHIIFSYYLFHYFKNFPLQVHLIFFIIAVTATLTGLNLLIAWNLHPELHHDQLWFDTPPFYTHIRQAGFHCSAAMLGMYAFCYYAINNPNKFPKELGTSRFQLIVAFALLLSTSTYLLWMGGRGAITGSYLAILCWLIFLGITKRPIFKFSIFIFLVTLIALALSEWMAVMPWNGVFSAAERSVGASTVNSFSSGREVIWSFSLDLVRPKLLLGLGAESYFLAENTPYGYQPDGSLIQFLMDWGIIGLILTIAILAYSFLVKIPAYRNKIPSFNFVSASAAFMIILSTGSDSLIDATLHHGQSSFHLAIAYALWFASLQKENQQTEISKI